MSDYLVGTLSGTQLGFNVACLVQNAGLTFACDESETKDEHGNTAVYQQFNHRAEMATTARVPYNITLPPQGSTLSISGVTLPSYTSAGVPSGGYSLVTGATSSTVDFVITDASLNTVNGEVAEYSVTLRHYLENNIGSQNAVTSGSSSSSN